MPLQQVAEANLLGRSHDGHELGLDPIGVVLPGEPDPLREPGDVAVDADRRDTEGVAAQHVGRLASDVRERQQRFEVARHLAREARDDLGGAELHRLGLLAEEVDLVQQGLSSAGGAAA